MRGKKNLQNWIAHNVECLGHENTLRKNASPKGLYRKYETSKRQTTQYNNDPHVDPELVWKKKTKHTSFEIYVVSLKVQKPIYRVAVFVTIGYQKLIEPFFFGENPLSFYDKAYFVYLYLSGKLLPLSKVSSYHNIHTLRLSTGGFNARACHQIR